MKCISCNHNNLNAFLKIANSPKSVQVIDKKLLKFDKKVSLEILRCSKCGLVQLAKNNYVAYDYYDAYIMSRTYSNMAKKYFTNLAKDFVTSYSLQHKLIVDVGCGDGYFCTSLLKQKAKVIGIEPSKKACKLARDYGVKVINDYVDDKFDLAKSADAFVSLEVFEHISNPSELLTNIKKFLKVGGYGMIEVPSLIKSLRDRRYYDFFPDHVAYYSPASLSFMLQFNGFDVLSIKHVFFDNYIVAFFQYSEKLGLNRNIQNKFEAYKNEYVNFYKQLQGKKVAIWGAGAKGVTSLAFSNINTQDILFCVDSDPNKAGKFLSATHIPVVSPNVLLKTNVDVVVITAMTYVSEIIVKLKNTYKFSDDQIAVIAPKPKFLTQIKL